MRGICGTATVRGTLPDSTQGLFIVAYTTFPESIKALLTFQPLPPPAVSLPPAGDSTVFYTLPLPSGRYEWVLAVWQKQGTLKPEALTILAELLREALKFSETDSPKSLRFLCRVATGLQIAKSDVEDRLHYDLERSAVR